MLLDSSIQRLIQTINKKKNPSVIGLDPIIQKIPYYLSKINLEKYGNTIKAVTETIYQFNFAILEQIYDIVPAIKLQLACYELYGFEGISIYEKTIERAKQLGLIVIADGKRNDIGSTASLYAKGMLGSMPLIKGESQLSLIDFVTINPFLGSDGIIPFLEICREYQKGVFILVKTSNNSAKEYQDCLLKDIPLYLKIAQDVCTFSKQYLEGQKYSCIGAVVGATWSADMSVLRKTMPYSYFLIPGYGVQGASGKDITVAFDEEGYGAIVNSSRGIIFAWDTPKYKEQFAKEDFAYAARKAALDMQEDILTELKLVSKLPLGW